MPPFLSRINKKGGSISYSKHSRVAIELHILIMFVKSRFATYYLQDGTVCSVFSKLISKKYCLTIMDLFPKNFMGIVLRGRSQTTFTRFWLFLTTYPPIAPMLTFSMAWTLTKSGHFWTTYLPRHVNVVCERPLNTMLLVQKYFDKHLPNWWVDLSSNSSRLSTLADNCHMI